MAEYLNQTAKFIGNLPPYAIIGILAVLLLLIIGLRRILKGPPSRLIAFSGDSGSVLVSRKALQDLIRQTCLKDDWVEAARPTVKIVGKKINTTVTLRLSSPECLKETTERLQTRISRLLQKSLSFEQIGPIEIMVTSFGKHDVDEQVMIPTESETSSELTTVISSKKPDPPESQDSPATRQETKAK